MEGQVRNPLYSLSRVSAGDSECECAERWCYSQRYWRGSRAIMSEMRYRTMTTVRSRSSSVDSNQSHMSEALTQA